MHTAYCTLHTAHCTLHTAHCTRISASGLVVVVEATAPREGQSATVQLHFLSSLLQHTAEYQVLAVYRVYNIREGFFIAPLDKSKSTK